MPRRKSLSIKDIAKESGASLTTVSLVLNHRDHRISEATRRRVVDAVNRLGYRPSRLAQALQAQRSGFLAILVPRLHRAFADVYFGELISAIHDYASKTGYKVLLEVAHPEFIQTVQHRELFDRDIVDGMLCIGVTNKDDYLGDFADGTRPMILVNNYLPNTRLNSVRCNYEQAGRLAGEHLVGLGHRRIGLIHGAPEVQTTADLRVGFVAALAAAGVGLTSAYEVDGLFTEEGGAQAAATLLARDPGLTAVLAGNDKMAIGAISGLKHAGRRVPQDVSVVGCDDIHQGAFADPPLTTVHTPIYDIGQQACRRLLELVNGKVEAVQEVHAVSLTVRESAGPRA
jgi:DNA-binding LacI/PurR family transcriptional regulator